jgi:adenine-specific DNA-methyltransferase
MPRTNKKISTTPIDTVKHKDKRVNIPTEELRDFVKEDEAKPKTILYPRDPSLDPQLVWKGKDEQDAKDLAVPAVPVYIQEKIHPQAVIENVRAEAKKDKPEEQTSLFADFNGIKFEDLIDFYQHEQNWSNRMILGDSLLVMTSLAEKEGLKGKVQMIYFDPPYGIKFGSNWQVSTRKRDVKDAKAEDASRQPEQIKAFRDTWQLGIHSYLSYMRDRLVVARELLTETGSIFLQIGDENSHLVRGLMDEVFGSDNFVSQISFAKTTGFSGHYLSSICDTLIWYAKSLPVMKYRELYKEKTAGDEGASKYRPVETFSGLQGIGFASSRLATTDQVTSQGASANADQKFRFHGKTWLPPSGLHWKTTVEGLKNLTVADRIVVEGESLRYVRFLDDFPVFPLSNIWLDIGGIQSRTDPKIYVVQTATEAIKRCLLMTTDPGDLVLDPTCGSGTTAYVAEQWGRRWITIDTSRVALALARTRLMAAKYPYYYLADSPDGVKKDAEVTGKLPPDYKTEGDIKKGFVYKRVPHVTLKSIANNPDIKEGMKREEIDAAIARHADTETLYDQPYEDNKRIRVTGPFTVESLSPHRVLATDEERPTSEKEAQKAAGAGQFETMILDNLKKAGVQNTVKNERLKFDRLEPYAGEWLHFAGEYTEKGGVSKRVAVCIGPEHGTVGQELIKEAAKEAMKGAGFDLLVVCGFAFDAIVNETVKEFTPTPLNPPLSRGEKKGGNEIVAEGQKQYGRLPILLARMNPDLAMGEELLKKTGAGNLFMVFGEPDLKVKKVKDGKITVEIKGVDVYDPTTGQIRSASTDDIACWFIDTNYNGESFFVRHAYFLGADEPYDKLKRALRAEVDESAWSMLYSAVSRPFDTPEKGKIAVKVINHYGDEVLKVYEVK